MSVTSRDGERPGPQRNREPEQAALAGLVLRKPNTRAPYLLTNGDGRARSRHARPPLLALSPAWGRPQLPRIKVKPTHMRPCARPSASLNPEPPWEEELLTRSRPGPVRSWGQSRTLMGRMWYTPVTRSQGSARVDRQARAGTWATHGAADSQKSLAPPGGGDGGDAQVDLKDEESLGDEEHPELPSQGSSSQPDSLILSTAVSAGSGIMSHFAEEETEVQRVNSVTQQGHRGDVNLGLLTPSLWERTVSSAQGPSHCCSQPTYIRHRGKARPSAQALERTFSWRAFSSKKPYVHRTQAQSGKGGPQCLGDRHTPPP